VQRKDRTSEEYFEALQEILEESERTSQVVDSLMLLARADSGKEMLECAAAEACAIVQEAADQGEKLAQNYGLDFAARIPNRPVPVKADRNALRRALLILLDNAVKYTPRGGSVKVNLEMTKDSAIVSVSDTGIGIAKSDVPHIFDRFWRADKARSREQGGPGLGLSIAQWIVEMHRGSIDVESEPGKGSTFRVLLPIDHGGKGDLQ
jgi:signal transduction histidine kinase